VATREQYIPGPASGAQIDKQGERWTLILTRDLRHAPENVWEALTDPSQLAQWAPFDVDRNLSTTGPAKLFLASAPSPQTFHSTVKRAERPRLLEYTWGDADVRWELEPLPTGTRLKLWHNIDRRFIAWGAAGWHICFDVLDHLLAGHPLGRIVGADALQFEWQRLNQEYAAQFGIETPAFPGARAQQSSDARQS
jgi:uncharacterized protein YndB with AHSA1/START domain